MDKLDLLINTIFFSKITWIISALILLYLNGGKYHSNEEVSNTVFIVETIDHIAHFVFHFTIALLLVYLFNHLTKEKTCVKGETKLHLYLFGIFTIIMNVYKNVMILYHKNKSSKD
jgi:uncharacterized membrane protein